MKYIRTKDGRIIDLTSKQVSSYEIIDDKKAIDEYGEESGFICIYYYDEDIGEHIEYDGKGSRSMDSWHLKDIIKQADTIEELCDEFVYHFLVSNTYEIMPKEDLEPQRKDCLLFHIKEKHHEVLGAIWTDKGLIYVAKMNEKGELELL